MTHDFYKLAIHEKIAHPNIKISLKSQQSTVNSQQSFPGHSLLDVFGANPYFCHHCLNLS
ncbi:MULTISPECIES: hypothetical protein [Calothrix]|uniref:Uncharacterized protein n=2 Tax=Calothrix TaxID=1186 RepID=A0ABR8AMH5_9CYAN|nr:MULTISPECIES: hypothetical protein [Calothrix]MBD2199871.1 hypothetical protein [Calothrix parietina FACHB-288]MBD2228782.1 hypothetical protein [Calothrix anomala FACHB-343]